MKRLISTLKPTDFTNHPIWEWDLNSDDDQSLVPVLDYPVPTIDNRIIGIKCVLSNDENVSCILSNIDLSNQEKTDLFITLSAWNGSRYINLCRYFDAGYDNHGPDHLATALGYVVNQIFPIRWDISKYVKSITSCSSGLIHANPKKRITLVEIIKLALG